MFIEQIVGIKKAIVLSILIIYFGHATILNKLFDYSISKVLKFNIEIKLNILYIFSGGEDILEGTVYIWLDLL